MSIKSTKLFCYIAFNTLESYLCNTPQNEELVNSIPTDVYPLFVTFHIDKDRLRGCIGNLRGLSLRQGIPQYALIASQRDHRFNPISKEELPRLSVSVSLLVDYEEAANALDWEVGKHGIIIEYHGYSATYLPEVAREQGWDQKTTIKHLLQKAGVREAYTDSMLPEIKCTRYQSSIETLTWDEYERMKK